MNLAMYYRALTRIDKFALSEEYVVFGYANFQLTTESSRYLMWLTYLLLM